MTPERIRRFSYTDQRTRFSDACGWLKSLGVRINKTRMARYARDLEQVDDFFAKGKIDELTERSGYARLMNSLAEATELIDIHEGLRSIPASSGLVARLDKFVGGPDMLVDEISPANVARSTGFELLVGAIAASAGLPVTFDLSVDLLVPIDPHPVGIECKRPLSHMKMPRRISEGIRQLNDFCKCGDLHRGMLALSVSKAENDGSLILPARDAHDLGAKAFGIIEDFRRRHERHWQCALGSRTLAVLLHLRAPCHVETPNLFTISTHLAFVAFDFPGSTNRATLEQVAAPINSFVQRQRSSTA